MHMPPQQRIGSLRGVFNRDFVESAPVFFRGKKINPVVADGPSLDILFRHLTTEVVDKKTRHREFEPDRSHRLHWIKHHLCECSPDAIEVFSVEDEGGIRTYIYDETNSYVIILAPYRNGLEYYLITAYYLTGRNPEKIKRKMARKLPTIY